MTHDATYNKNIIAEKLVGGKITDVFVDSDNPDDCYGFRVVNKGKTYNVWIDSDEEGNSCGSVKTEEVKHERTKEVKG